MRLSPDHYALYHFAFETRSSSPRAASRRVESIAPNRSLNLPLRAKGVYACPCTAPWLQFAILLPVWIRTLLAKPSHKDEWEMISPCMADHSIRSLSEPWG